jgi:hypothetical protein
VSLLNDGNISTLNNASIQTEDQLIDFLQVCLSDSAMYMRSFMPHLFHKPFARMHLEILAAIDALDEQGYPKYKKIVIKAPRGSGKTAMMAEGLVSKKMNYELTRFIIYCSATATHGERSGENIKGEMLSNDLMRACFGDISTQSSESVRNQFSKTSWVTNKDVLFMPRGSGQQVRGLRYKQFRPGLIIIDDYEEDDTIDNVEIRNKNDDWLTASLLNVVEMDSLNHQFIYIDTLKHEDAVLARLLERDDWYHMEYSLCDEEYNSLMPEFISTESIKAEVEIARANGKLDIFYREKMGQPVAKENKSFKSEFYKYYNIDKDVYKDDQVEYAMSDILKRGKYIIIIDPAKSVNPESCESAIVVYLLYKNRLFFHDVISDKVSPSKLAESVMTLYAKYRPIVVAWETTGLGDYALYPMKTLMVKNSLFFDIYELTAKRGSTGEFRGRDGGKNERIVSMIPLYEVGYIVHNIKVSDRLEMQQAAFPRSKKRDIIDASGYITELLDKGLIYFEDYQDLPAIDEYKDLDYDDNYEDLDVLHGDWRTL